jgi:hypothetical protein
LFVEVITSSHLYDEVITSSIFSDEVTTSSISSNEGYNFVNFLDEVITSFAGVTLIRHIYRITCVEGLERENEYERRDDDVRSKTISYGRKKDITSRERKVEQKKRCDGDACNSVDGRPLDDLQ